MTTRQPAARRAIAWLGESPDATTANTSPVTASDSAQSSQVSGVAGTARPRKAERRAARRAAFYAERRRSAPGPRALFEVAADQVRALDEERAFTAATKALDQVIARFAP